MDIKNYDELGSMEIDTLREIGSIGTGNAASALSTMLDREIRITLPEVRIMGYNEAIEWIGGPEAITAGVLVHISGQMSGVMLATQSLEFINLALGSGKLVQGYLERSNADFANEISKVIESQRSFQYMLRMVTTSDEIETTVNNLR